MSVVYILDPTHKTSANFTYDQANEFKLIFVEHLKSLFNPFVLSEGDFLFVDTDDVQQLQEIKDLNLSIPNYVKITLASDNPVDKIRTVPRPIDINSVRLAVLGHPVEFGHFLDAPITIPAPKQDSKPIGTLSDNSVETKSEDILAKDEPEPAQERDIKQFQPEPEEKVEKAFQDSVQKQVKINKPGKPSKTKASNKKESKKPTAKKPSQKTSKKQPYKKQKRVEPAEESDLSALINSSFTPKETEVPFAGVHKEEAPVTAPVVEEITEQKMTAPETEDSQAPDENIEDLLSEMAEPEVKENSDTPAAKEEPAQEKPVAEVAQELTKPAGDNPQEEELDNFEFDSDVKTSEPEEISDFTFESTPKEEAKSDESDVNFSFDEGEDKSSTDQLEDFTFDIEDNPKENTPVQEETSFSFDEPAVSEEIADFSFDESKESLSDFKFDEPEEVAPEIVMPEDTLDYNKPAQSMKQVQTAKPDDNWAAAAFGKSAPSTNATIEEVKPKQEEEDPMNDLLKDLGDI